MQSIRMLFKTRVDVRWLTVTYCFFVLFHLFPSFLCGLPITFFRGNDIFFRGYSAIWPILLWLATGIVFISAYVGFQSRSVTIIESGAASVLYVLTLMFGTSTWAILPPKFRVLIVLLWLVLFLLLSFLLGCGGAAFGVWLKVRKRAGDQR